MNCPKCGSDQINTYRHPGAKQWCGACGFILREEQNYLSQENFKIGGKMKIEFVGNKPTKAHDTDAGYDLVSSIDFEIKPNERVLIPSGTKIALPKGYCAQVRSRSGLAIKYGIHVLNSPGTVDADYRGDVGVILHNAGSVAFQIRKGDRIAQLIIEKVVESEMVEVSDLDETKRGAGGFGSTGLRSCPKCYIPMTGDKCTVCKG